MSGRAKAAASRWGCAWAGLLLLWGCPQAPQVEADAGLRPEPYAGGIVPAAHTTSVAVTATTAAAAAAAPDAGVLAERPLDREEKSCGKRPGWLGLARCRRGPHAYATAAIAGVKDLSLARTTAAMRAREALLSGMKIASPVRGLEVIDVWSCKGASNALARLALPEADPGISLPACPEQRIDLRSGPAPGCAPWTQHLSWREGHQLSVVGTAKAKNSALAVATATNRARAEIARVLEGVRLGKSGKGLSEQVSGQPAYTEVSKQRSSCGGYEHVMLLVEPVEGGEQHH